MLWTPSRSLHQLDVFDVSISWIFLIVIKGVLIHNSKLTQKDGRAKKTANLAWQAPGGDSHIYRDGKARRLTLGCKLQILVSLRVLRRKVTIIFRPFRYRWGLCINKLTKNTVISVSISFPLGVSLSLSHTHIGLPYGFNFNFPTSISVTFIWKSSEVASVTKSANKHKPQ